MNDPRAAALQAKEYDQAKELHGRLHRDLTNDHEQLGPHGVDEHLAAMRLLEADYPALKSARRRYERAGERAHERDQRRGERPRAAGRPRQRGATPRPTARRRSAARSFGYGFATGRAHPYAEATGLPGTSRSATSLVLGGLGGIIGLSIVYDVLVSSEKGGKASAPLLFFEGIFGLLNRVVAPVDPLGPSTSTPTLGSGLAGGVNHAAGVGSAALLKAAHQRQTAPGRPTNVTNLTTLGRTV